MALYKMYLVFTYLLTCKFLVFGACRFVGSSMNSSCLFIIRSVC